MSSIRTLEERLAENKKRQEALKAEEKRLKARAAAEKRNKRTKRLIEFGAIAESVLERPLEDADKETFLAFLNQQEQRGSFFSKAMNRIPSFVEKQDE